MARPTAHLELRAARSYPVVVLVSAVDRRILPALRFVSRLPFADPMALHVSLDDDLAVAVARKWMALELTWLPLHIREAHDGDIARSVAALVDDQRSDSDIVTVVVPELYVARWWHPLLHRQTARRIAAELQATPGVTTVVVPFSPT